MDIKPISGTEIDQVLELILRVFMEFEAPVYSREGNSGLSGDTTSNFDQLWQNPGLN